MPEAIITINGRKAKITGKSREDILARADQLRQQASSIKDQDNNVGEIRQVRPFEEAMPGVGQFVGGMVGGVAGGLVGQPTLGAIAGGTAGRTVGLIEQEKQQILRDEPEKARIIRGAKIASQFAFPTTPILSSIAEGVATVSQLDNTTKVKLGKEILKTGAIETISGGIGKGISSLATKFGKGVAEEVLGKRVAQRGSERGWKTLLDKRFYQGRIPKMIAEKTDNFFNKLTNTTGKGVKTAIENTARREPKKALINITEIKNEIKGFLPDSGNPVDLVSEFAPKAQKERIKTITDKVLKLRGNVRKVDNLWELRKEIDRDIYKLKWSDDALNYLQKLRTSLNKPIKSASPEIAEAFEKYSFVKEAENKLYKNFEAITGEGEIYADKLESYVGNLLSTKKDETIRMLKHLDTFNKAPDKVVDELLDLAAAESLEKGIPDISFLGKVIGGLLGGRKMIPRIAAVAQEPSVKGLARAAGRVIPVTASESFEE